jgi:ACS family D-galactonate transporter-like MFS transporter
VAATPGSGGLSRLPRRRWRIAWLLGLGVLINYIDRVNVSVSHDALFAAFGVSDVVFGYLSGAFNWTYGLCQLPVGVILDKLGVRRVGLIGTFLWSVASFAAAITPTLSGLFGARFLLGVGEAPIFPANAKAIGLWFPARQRGLSTAMFDAAAKFAPAIGVPLLGAVLLAVGWRWSFAFTGFLSLAFFALFWRVYRDPEDDPELTETERSFIEETAEAETRPGKPPSSLLHLLGQRKVLGLAIGFASYNYVFYLLLYWLPSYFSFALHTDLSHSFAYTSVPWMIATFVDVAVGGWLVDALIHRGWDSSKVRQTVLIGGTACGLGILGAAHAHGPVQAIFWISLSIGGLGAAAPVGWSAPSLIAVRSDVGKVGGILNLANQIAGIAAPIVTGYVVSVRHSYAWAFGVASIFLVIGIAAYIVLLGKIELPQAQTAPT